VALERVEFLLQDWQYTQRQLADAESRMISLLDELGLTELVTSITGLSAIGAAAILAETGDPTRFATARAHRANPVYPARYRHLTSREDNRLSPTQAQAAIAAAILRHLPAVVTTGQRWDPRIATHGTRTPAMTTAA
jgi:transposase